jgi:hypothetical protein
MKNCLILLLGLISMQIQGQKLRFSIIQNLRVNQNGTNLSLPWAGGMNSMQYQSMDLNSDGIVDLVSYDRTSQQISTFLQDRLGSFVFSPQYISKFPRIENWFVLVDYNRDGQKDLFSSTSAGIKVYENKSTANQIVFELVKEPLFSVGFSGLINLYVAAPDIPVVADVDQDGDVDILAFEPGGHYIEFHENISIQKSGTAGLQFVKSPTNWGNIIHQDCKSIQLLQSEKRSDAVQLKNKVAHVGNSLGITAQNDLFLGQVSCDNLTFLKNIGTNQQVKYSNIDYDFLSTKAVSPGVFYTATPLQLTGNSEDVFVSVNSADNVGYLQDFQHSSFQVSSGKATPFLQDQMIDVGEKASPCFFDIDADGDLDLLIGHAGYRKANDVKAGIYLYENQLGTYNLKTSDYLGLTARESLTEIVLQVSGNQVIVVGQSSMGTKAYKIVNQQLSPINLELNFGEIPLFSPWGNMILTKSGRIQWSKSGLDWGQLGQYPWQIRTCQFADLDGDGTIEFIGIDMEGQWHVGNYQDETNTFTWLDADFFGLTVGRNARLQVADFTGDGRNDLIVGTGSGGVYLVENKSTSLVWEGLKNDAFQVWPNPNSGLIHVLANQPGEFQVFNRLGQLLDQVSIKSGKTYQFTHANMHVLRFVDAKGHVTTRKVQQD